MAVHKKPAAVRLRPETHDILDLLAQDTGLTRTGVIELAVRDLAKRRRVQLAASLPTLSEAHGRRSLLGVAAGLPGGSEEFLSQKSREKAREDSRHEARE